MKKLICLIIAFIMSLLFVGCNNGGSDIGDKFKNEENELSDTPESLFGQDTGSADDNASSATQGKYDKIECIVEGYDEGYIYKNYNGTNGLLNKNGDIIRDGFYCIRVFNDSNYIPCGDEAPLRFSRYTVKYLIDKKGNTVLKVGENNIEFISEITQGRIFAYQMTEEKPSGKTYDLICYSAKDMSEVFRINGVNEIYSYISFDETGYCDDIRDAGDRVLIDIYGNIYRWEKNKYYDSDGNEYKQTSYSSTEAEKYGLPKVSGLAPSEHDVDWYEVLKTYEEYQKSSDRAYSVGTIKNTLTQIATLYMKTTSVWYATMDMNGNVLMAPTKDIELGTGEYDQFVFSNDLCCAYEPSSGLWGYVDVYGNWKIKPQYESVTTFSYAGYAVVDELLVIDTNGEVVLDISERGDLHPLEGKYKLSGAYFPLYLTFSRDGNVVVDGGYTCAYEVHSDTLVIYSESISALYGTGLNSGANTFEQDGDNLIIEGKRWILQKEE